MSDRQSIVLWNVSQGHEVITRLWAWAKPMVMQGRRIVVEWREENRSDAQNRRQWSILTDISRQVVFFGQKYVPEDWKDIITASLDGELRMAPTTDGKRMVILGLRTSKMSKRRHCEFTEFAMAFGDENGVEWSATSLGREFSLEEA